MLACAPSFAQKVDLTAGWTYEKSDQGNGYANLNGWYGSVSYNVLPRIGLSFEHESYWGGYSGSRTNQHVWLGGLTFKLANSEHKVVPFVQPMVGDTRSSMGSIQHYFTFQLSGGADIKIKGPLSLELVPAEYVMTDQSGTPTHSYSAAAGLQFSSGK